MCRAWRFVCLGSQSRQQGCSWALALGGQQLSLFLATLPLALGSAFLVDREMGIHAPCPRASRTSDCLDTGWIQVQPLFVSDQDNSELYLALQSPPAGVKPPSLLLYLKSHPQLTSSLPCPANSTYLIGLPGRTSQ